MLIYIIWADLNSCDIFCSNETSFSLRTCQRVNIALTGSFGENEYYLYTAQCSICNLNTGRFQNKVANSMMYYFLGEKDDKSSYDRGSIYFRLPSSSNRSIIFYYKIDI